MLAPLRNFFMAMDATRLQEESHEKLNQAIEKSRENLNHAIKRDDGRWQLQVKRRTATAGRCDQRPRTGPARPEPAEKAIYAAGPRAKRALAEHLAQPDDVGRHRHGRILPE